MASPVDWLSLDSRYLLFIGSLGVVLVLGSWMGRVQKGQEGRTPGLPRVSQMEIEFAADPGTVAQLKKDWGAEGIARARRLIHWDFVFLLAYPCLLALACTFAARGPFGHGRVTGGLGILLAWGSLVAALADVGANVAMLRILQQNTVTAAALTTAKVFAGIEFSLVGFALIYSVAAMLLSLLGPSVAP